MLRPSKGSQGMWEMFSEKAAEVGTTGSLACIPGHLHRYDKAMPSRKKGGVKRKHVNLIVVQ